MQKNARLLIPVLVITYLFYLSSTLIQAADGKIVGKVLYRKTNKPVYFAKAILYKDGKSTRKGTSIESPKPFTIASPQSGTFDLRITSLDCATVLVKDLTIQAGKTIDIGEVKLILYTPYTTRGTYQIRDTTNSLFDRSWFVRLDDDAENQYENKLGKQLKFVGELAKTMKTEFKLKLMKDSIQAIGILHVLPEFDQSGNVGSVFVTLASERWKTCLLIKNFNSQSNAEFVKYSSRVITESMSKMKFDLILQAEG